MAETTFTQEQLTALEAAIASGTLEVYYGDKKVKYQTITEMLKARDIIRKALGLDGGGSGQPGGRRLADFHRGL